MREIDNKEKELAGALNFADDKFEADQVASEYIPLFEEMFYNDMVKGIEIRLKKCADEEDRKQLIEAEKEQYNDLINFDTKPFEKPVVNTFGLAYKNTRLRRPSYLFSDYVLQKEDSSKGNAHYVKMYGWGAAYYRYEKYLNKLLENGSADNAATSDKKPKHDDKEKYNELKDIFVSNAAYDEAMEALRRVKFPVISDDNTFLLGTRQKGAFAAWIAVLKLRGKIKSATDRELAELLNKEIKGLNLYEDGSALADERTTAYRKYYTPLLSLIS